MKTANEQVNMKRMWRTVVDNLLNRSSDNDSSQPPTTTERRRSSDVVARHNNGPLLYGTTNLDQHQAIIATALHICHLYQQQQQGCDDDFDCTTHDHVTPNGDAPHTFSTNGCNDNNNNHNNNIDNRSNNHSNHQARNALSTLGFEYRRTMKSSNIDDDNGNLITEAATTPSSGAKFADKDIIKQQQHEDHDITQLYHISSNTRITTHNRQTYIADGNMYDAIANLCQDVAHEIMIECCNLSWKTICNNRKDVNGSNSCSSSNRCGESKVQQNNIIRVLVGTTNKNESKCNTNTTNNNIYNKDDDVLLIITGKGKVRSGIFSRRHLLTTGIEPSTALPIIQMATQRNMKVVILDPNARGDEVGMDTFEISIRTLFEEQSATTSANNMNGSLYILAHSAGGGQLVRYLMSNRTSTLLSRMRCIVFTDSTHNVQWIKKQQQQQVDEQSSSSSSSQTILSLIQSPSVALYIRSANKMHIDNWKSLKSGNDCTIVDEYWVHRFGTIRTVWAGTTDHSLSNWTSMKVIWDHIDQIRDERENQ